MVALWTAHAQLSRFYLDSTPCGRRERGPPWEYEGQRAWGRGYRIHTRDYEWGGGGGGGVDGGIFKRVHIPAAACRSIGNRHSTNEEEELATGLDNFVSSPSCSPTWNPTATHKITASPIRTISHTNRNNIRGGLRARIKRCKINYVKAL